MNSTNFSVKYEVRCSAVRVGKRCSMGGLRKEGKLWKSHEGRGVRDNKLERCKGNVFLYLGPGQD